MDLDVSVEKQHGDFHFSAAFSLSTGRCGIFGPSGSGKSTLMHLLAGLLTPDSGTIRLAGQILFDHATGINMAPEQRRIGVVFQHSHLFPHMDVRANLFYGWKRTKASERRIAGKTLIDALNLGHLLDRNVKRLSGGERQRVALGRTLLACPRLILMDEPLTGLDEELKYQIIPYLRKAFAEFAIPLLFVSHSLREMRLMTEEVLTFREGKLQATLSTEMLARNSMAASGYLNMLSLGRPELAGDLHAYQWGNSQLILTEKGEGTENLFELDARDIVLFKRHPEATSARNLLACQVVSIFGVNNRVGVELACGNEKLIAQIVPESVRELDITVGSEIVAVIKASSFRKLL